MNGSATVSAFAARRTVGPKEPRLAPPDLVLTEDSPEDLGPSSSVEDDDFSHSSASVDENQFSVLRDSNTGFSTRPKRIFELGEDAIRVELAESQSIAVLGVYAIWVKCGEISILGARLQASPLLHKIFAPATLALPQITARSQKADIVLTSTYDGLRDLQVVPRRMIWDIPGQTSSSQRTFQIVGYSFQYDEGIRKRLKILDLIKWRSTMATISKPLPEGRTVLVCGSGSTGKSTFCRTSINQILTDQKFSGDIEETKAGVLLIDLDLVQPELMPGGLISLAHVKSTLLGSPESHYAIQGSNQSRILRMHYLGEIKDDAISLAGLNAIKDLLQHCANIRKDLPGCPVLVNSSSWLLDIGYTELSNLISIMRPSDIVYFDSSGSLKYREVLTRSMGSRCNLWGLATKVYRSDPASTIHWSHMQSYLQLATSRSHGHYWDPLALLSYNKKELSYSGTDSMIWAVVTLGERLAPDNIAQALEGSMTAIVVVQEDGCEAQNNQFSDERPKHVTNDLAPNVPNMLDKQQADPAKIARTPGENLPYFLNSDVEATFLHPRRSDCLGLAYITAIDAERETVEVITPISRQTMSTQRENGLGLVLVMGRQELRWTSVHD